MIEKWPKVNIFYKVSNYSNINCKKKINIFWNEEFIDLTYHYDNEFPFNF